VGVALGDVDATAVDGTPLSSTTDGSRIGPVDVRNVRIAELVGPVGAGKSTLLRHLERALRERGVMTLPPALAVDRGLGRSAVGPLVRPLLGRPGTAPVTRQLLVDLPYGLWTMVRRPRLGLSVARALLGSPLPWWHRRLILRLWLEVAGREAFVRSRLAPGEALVFDEGLVHRAVNLFAWQPAATAGAVISYLTRAPRPDLVVVVAASPEVAAERIATRGLPKRLRGRDDVQVAEFLQRARQVLDTTETWLAASGVPMVRIENAGPLDTVPSILDERLRALLGTPSAGVPPAVTQAPPFEPRFGGLPRPLARRLPGRRRSAPLPRDAVVDVLARLGLASIAPGRAIAGGRGTSTVVATDRGPVLVKRYKPSVDEGSLRGEHAILRRLELADFAAPRLVEGPAGETFVERSDGLYAAFHYLDGYRRADARMLIGSDPRHLAWTAGATLGALHATLDGFVPPTVSPNGFRSMTGSRVRDLGWYLGRLDVAIKASAIQDDDDRVRLLVARAEAIAEELERLDAVLAASDPERGVIHGDYGPYNLLVRQGRPLTVVDFELARLDWRLTDLVTALPRFAARRSGSSRDRAFAFATGYLAHCAMRPAELERLPEVGAYLALRRAVVCWARWADTADRQWLAEAIEKMDLAWAYREARHPLIPVVEALGRS
jgi:Ser/Thr protein kinase RdoA (MazF antagonist)/ribose 1,5-bisphosphokinase PhnN